LAIIAAGGTRSIATRHALACAAQRGGHVGGASIAPAAARHRLVSSRPIAGTPEPARVDVVPHDNPPEKRMKKILLSLCLLLVGTFAVPRDAQAASCVSITALPATISAAGVYCLIGNQDVNLATGNAITIAANNVQLDCVGQTINNVATAPNGNAVGIYLAGRKHVDVRNCRITGGFATGIQAYQNNAAANTNAYLRFTDNYIAGPFWYGIYAYGSAIEIERNRIYDIGGRGSFAMGIRIGGSNLAGQSRFFLLRENLVAGTASPVNNAYGIYSDNTNAAIILNNAVSGTTAVSTSFNSYGVRVASGTYNRITDNHIVGSGGANDVGIQSASGTDACHDNYLRNATTTIGCNDSLGNF
jgi:hypothetical protein